MSQAIVDDVHLMQDELVTIRHDIHAHPEIALEEKRTAALITAYLKKWGIDVAEGVGGYGVVGTLKSTNPSDRSIGLRADMDALKLIEKSNLPYTSTVPGMMHACGHDGHMAMLLGAAKYLSEHRDSFSGTFQFIFQPAEEGLKGALAMINDGLFNRFPVDAVYGIHNMSDPLGTFSICPGPFMAASDRWYVTFYGTGGHGGAGVHLATDVTVLQAQFILALQTIVSRNVKALDTAVISVGAIHGGSAECANVMPSEIRIAGTARSFNPSVRDLIERRIKEIAHSMAAVFNCTASVEYSRGGIPLVNDEDRTRRAIRAAESVVGPKNVNRNREPSMGGEDFAYLLLERPGAFIFLGTYEDGRSVNIHSPDYDFNDKAIPFGVAYWITLVQQELPAE